MFEQIKKRNGDLVKFNPDKIKNAILSAGEATGEFEDEDTAEKLMMRVLSIAESSIEKEIPSVEEIQDIVEEVLLSSTYKKTAKSYIIYREQHRKIREMINSARVDLVDQYLEKDDWKVKENSNMGYSLQGLNNYISSELSSVYWLNNIYPPEVKKEHKEGGFHIHDLSQLSVYCVGWDLMDLLLTGFKGAEGKVQSAPAQHFRSALGQIVNFFYTLQGEAAGAQAFSHIDTLLAPFIRRDDLSYGDVKQCMQEFIFNINVPTRVGFQAPFTNITLDLVVPETHKDENVIIGGEYQNSTYSEYQEEINMFNKAFLEVMSEGDARDRVFTFPIPTYNITEDFDWDNPTLEYLWEITGKYGIPYFSNFVNSSMDPNDTRSMCCRLRLDNREVEHRGGGLFGSNPLTGSIGVVTMNLPRIGYTAENKQEFINMLGEKMEIAKKSLEIKRKILERYTERGLYPYIKYYLRSIKSQTGKYWSNHFSTIGLIGMNEAMENLLGCSIGDEEGQRFAQRVMDFMKKKLDVFSMKTGNNYNLEATPGESTTYRLAKLDKAKYSDIITADELEESAEESEPFYTNSSHLPVNYTNDVFEMLDKQDELQTKYTGGTVVHLYTGERINSNESIKNLVKKICHNYKLPYFTITPSFSICPQHGYLEGEQPECPKCEKDTEVYSRVVGYLRPVDQWNEGKREEFDQRRTYKMEG